MCDLVFFFIEETPTNAVVIEICNEKDDYLDFLLKVSLKLKVCLRASSTETLV